MDEAFRSFPADDGSMIALSSGLNKVFRIGIMKMRQAGRQAWQGGQRAWHHRGQGVTKELIVATKKLLLLSQREGTTF